MEWIVVGILVVLVQSVLAYGLTFAYFQRKYPYLGQEDYLEDKKVARLTGIAQLGAPLVGLIAVLFLTGFGRYGLKFR